MCVCEEGRRSPTAQTTNYDQSLIFFSSNTLQLCCFGVVVLFVFVLLQLKVKNKTKYLKKKII